jgi:replicative DNA helicase
MPDDQALQDISAEAAFLGSLILDCSLWPTSKDVIYDADFFISPEHQHIYTAISEAVNAGKPLDLVILRDQLIADNRLAACGGVDYLVRVAESTPTSANILYYAEIVREKYLRRRAISISRNAISQLSDATNKTEDITSRTSESYNQLFSDSVNERSHQMLSDVFAEMENKEPQRYVATGYQKHDDFYYGFGQGHVVIIAGRPSMGKTALMLGMAHRMSSDNKTKIAYFSLEMTKQDIANRVLGQLADLNMPECYRGWGPDETKSAMESARRSTKLQGFIIDQTRYLTTDLLRNKVRFYQAKYGIQAAFVDYLQLLNSSEKTKDLYTRVCLLSHELKSIALSLNIPLIIGCQLNRGVEHRPDKTPKMSDLRDSGKIEEDADLIIMLHRPAYYEKKSSLLDNETETAQIIIEKNRASGKTGVIDMEFNHHCGRFDDKD